jgi:hypothetical protein
LVGSRNTTTTYAMCQGMALQLRCGLRVSAPTKQIVDGGISRGTSGFPKKTVSLGFIARQWSLAP